MQVFKTTILLICLAFVACKADPKNNTKAPDTTNTATTSAAPVKPEIILYGVNVDNLQLRDAPALTGANVVTKFPEGSFVTGTGEKSDNQVEVELRGIPYKDHFYKVTSTTDQQTGWAFAGALTPVYAGTVAGKPDQGRLSQLSSFLKTLNTKDQKSGKKAWDFLNANYSDVNGALADAVYILFYNFMFRMEVEGEFYTMTEKIKWKDDEYETISRGKFDMNTYPLTKSLAENGFRLETAEGMIFPVSDWQRNYAFFGEKVTPVMKTFLNEYVLENNARDSDDGGLIIPLSDMVKRAAFWEKFNKENPWFVMSANTVITEQWTRAVVIGGMDNTPMYDYESKAINEEFKNAWTTAQQQYPGTILAQRCKEISDLCAANGWKYSDAVEKWHSDFVEKNYQ